MMKLAQTVSMGVTGLAFAAALSMPALADGLPGSIKDGPVAAAKPDYEISYNFGVTTDYIFRGFSQSRERPAVQGGTDVTYKNFYIGTWSSSIDFGNGPTKAFVETDYYAGFKPKFGPVTLDLGVIYYTYPFAKDRGPELDYVELKLGVSLEPWKDASIGVTAFYSPEYTTKTGSVFTLEVSASQTLPKIGSITPSISALLGYQTGDSAAYSAVFANGDDNYLYWNAGLGLAFSDNFSLDLRYWDTNLANNFCAGPVFACDARFVATAKFTY